MSDKGIKDPRKVLTIKQQAFVTEYLKCGNASQAARAAGYSQKCAGHAGARMLRESALVRDAVAAARNSLVEQGVYNYTQAMKEADDAIRFAKETENANALVRAIEHKSKLSGLLVEKVDVRSVGFQIHIKGVDDEPSE